MERIANSVGRCVGSRQAAAGELGWRWRWVSDECGFTGQSPGPQRRHHWVGFDNVHVAVYDHSRQVFVEHADEKGPICAGVLELTAAFMVRTGNQWGPRPHRRPGS